VRFVRFGRISDQQTAAHSQVHHHRIAILEIEEEVLAPPARIDERLPQQTRTNDVWPGSPDTALPADRDVSDARTDDRVVQ